MTLIKNNNYTKKSAVLFFLVIMIATLFGCGSKAKTEALPESNVSLEAGTYTGVLIVTELPVVEYAQKALDDPESLPAIEGEEAEVCEEVDLDNKEVRTQIEDAISKGKSTIGVEVPMTIIITEGAIEGEYTGTVKADFAAAFPDYGCEEATDEPYVLTHKPGEIRLQNVTDEDSIKTTTLLDGAILKDGVLKGVFEVTNASDEYLEFTGSNIMMKGTWEVKK